MGFIEKEKTDELMSFSTAFVWRIEKYDLNENYTETVALSDNTECILELNPFFIKKSDQIRVFLNVTFTKVPPESKYFPRFECRVQAGKIVDLYEIQSTKVRLGHKNPAYPNNLTEDTYKNCVKTDGALELSFQFLVREENRDIIITHGSKSQLARNLPKAYIVDPTKDSDISLICADNEVVPAHKFVLAARSPVFATALTEETDKYEIEGGIKKEIVKQFLRFLYSDVVGESTMKTHCLDLYQLASKYEVSELKKLCENELQKFSINFESTCKRIAEMSLPELKRSESFVRLMKSMKDIEDLAAEIPPAKSDQYNFNYQC